jgi:hypothetical protein
MTLLNPIMELQHVVLGLLTHYTALVRNNGVVYPNNNFSSPISLVAGIISGGRKLRRVTAHNRYINSRFLANIIYAKFQRQDGVIL